MTDNLQPWSASATAGVAYFNAIQADLYSNANGRIRFNTGKQGEMRFVFDVTGLDGEGILGPDFYRMRMTYSNAGRSAPAVVETVLKRVSSTSGNISNLASVTSANQPQAGTGVVVNAFSGSIDLNKFTFQSHFFYIVATISRTSLSWNPTFIGVALTPGATT